MALTILEDEPNHDGDATASFTFVNIMGDIRQSDSTKTIVRSHVMRCHHSKRRHQIHKHKLLSTRLLVPWEDTSRIASSRSDGLALSSESREGALKMRQGSSIPVQEASFPVHSSACANRNLVSVAERGSNDSDMSALTGRINGYDVFNVLPITSTPRIHMLLNNSRSHTKRTSIYAGAQDEVFTHAGSSAALMWAVLSAEVFSQCGWYALREGMCYLQNAISSINDVLSQPKQIIDDSIIAAITHLANWEVMCGNDSASATHVAGLRAMVHIHGGANSLGMNGIVRRWVLWSDLVAATRFQRPPTFGLVSLPILSSLEKFLPPSAPKIEPLAVSRSLVSSLASSECLDLLPILSDFHELACFLNATNITSSDVLLKVGFHDRIYVAEYRILVLLHQHRTCHKQDVDSDDIGMIMLLSSLLYIYSNLRLTNPGGGIRRSLASRLQTALASLTSSHTEIGRELLWALFLGVTSCEPDKRSWFLERITELCALLKLRKWYSIAKELNESVQLEDGCWEDCKKLWVEYQGINDRSDGPLTSTLPGLPRRKRVS